MNVPSGGEQTFHIWMREDGAIIDRVVLTKNASLSVSGDGPAVSGRSPMPTVAALSSTTGLNEVEVTMGRTGFLTYPATAGGGNPSAGFLEVSEDLETWMDLESAGRASLDTIEYDGVLITEVLTSVEDLPSQQFFRLRSANPNPKAGGLD